MRQFLFLTLLAVANVTAYADDFGSWIDVQLNHKFSNEVYSAIRIEHRTKNNMKDLDVWFVRPTIGYNLTSWLKADLSYDFLRTTTTTTHRSLLGITGTLRQGNMSMSIKERWQYAYTPDSKKAANTLRSKFTASYAIPNSIFKPYVAMEIFTDKKWQKTRHYIGTDIKLSRQSSLDVYYLWYTFADNTASHIIGLGYNLNL